MLQYIGRVKYTHIRVDQIDKVHLYKVDAGWEIPLAWII